MNRLRTYLSWKEVRKTARKEECSATKGGAEVELEDLDDDLVGQYHCDSGLMSCIDFNPGLNL